MRREGYANGLESCKFVLNIQSFREPREYLSTLLMFHPVYRVRTYRARRKRYKGTRWKCWSTRERKHCNLSHFRGSRPTGNRTCWPTLTRMDLWTHDCKSVNKKKKKKDKLFFTREKKKLLIGRKEDYYMKMISKTDRVLSLVELNFVLSIVLIN